MKFALLPFLFLCLSLHAAPKASLRKPRPLPPLRIGFIAGLSGPQSESAQKALKALELIVSDFNLSGGVAGRRIEIVTYDNKRSPINNFAIFKEIKKDHLVALTGVHNSNDGLIIAKLAEGMHLPLVVASATHPDITKGRRFVVRVCFNNAAEATFLSHFAKKDLRVKRVAILTDVSDSFTTSLSSLFATQFAQGGGKIVYQQDIRTNDRDFTSFIQTLTALKEKPEAILAATSAMEGGYLISQLASSGFSIPVIGNDGWQTNNLGTALEKITHDGITAYFPAHWHTNVNLPESNTFLKEYEKRYGENLNSADVDAALTYDAGNTLITALSRANSVETGAVMAALKNNPLGGVSGRIDLRNGDPKKTIYMLSIRKGKLITPGVAE